MEVLYFLLNQFNNIINILFSTDTAFGVSFGAIIFGVFIIGAAMSLFARMFDIFPQDVSSLGSPKDYFVNKVKNSKGYSRRTYNEKSAELKRNTRKNMLSNYSPEDKWIYKE